MLPFLQDQSSIPELREMERQRTVRNPKRIGNCASGHSLITSLDEKAEQCEAMLLGEGGKR
jgi:hypothetical protein